MEHLVLGERGLPDEAIRQRLMTEDDLVFLTQDTEFEGTPKPYRSRVIISRLPQRIKTAQRVAAWHAALTTFIAAPPPGDLFELMENGMILPIEFYDIRE